MRRSVLIFAITAAVILAVTQFAPAEDGRGTTVAVPGTVPGIHLPLYIFIPKGGARPDNPLPGAETPSSIACIYGVTKKTAGCPQDGSVVATGGSKAIAVVEYGSNSTVQSDFNTFNSTFGLPAATLTQICATGGTCPSNDGTGWDLETALDVQYAHSMAPGAEIYIAEFSDDPLGDGAETDAAEAVAAAGGGEVSNSWGYDGGEGWCGSAGCELNYDHYFVYSGVVFFASAGDSGATPQYPSVSPDVVSAGGTTVIRNGSGNYTTQDGWSGGGGGLSAYEPIPSYQSVIKSIVGTHRGTPDFSADANPDSGVAVYNSTYCGGWCQVGGTSVASPTLAGIANAAGGFLTSTNAELTKTYGEYGNATKYKKDFLDVTVGNNGQPCKKGWDFCTGIGAPKKDTAE